MRPFLTILSLAGLLTGLVSCGHEYNKDPALKEAYDRMSAYPADTVIALKSDCDSCRDLKLLQGGADGLQTGETFAVAGSLPLDLLDRNDMDFNPDISFRLVGKMLDDTARAPGKAVFYVSGFTRFSFRPEYWREKGAAGFYTRRNRMVQGVSDNLLFEGRRLAQITTLLGPPDTVLPGGVSYRIDDNRGGETDPKKASKLDIRFGADSIITGHEIVDPFLNVK